jgi:hypothetical protein
VEELAAPTFENYTKMAIRYADGIIFFGNKKNPAFEDAVKTAKKPAIHCKKPLQSIDECNDFYTQVIRTK